MKCAALMIVLLISSFAGHQDVQVPLIQDKPPVGADGWKPGMPLPKKEAFAYSVDIHFLFYSEQASKYPEIYNGFLHATSIWGQYLPVNFNFHMDTQYRVLGSDAIFAPIGIITIDILDLKDVTGVDGYLGLWSPKNERLFLDVELEKNSHKALCIAMHELGHLFGIPHIIGKEDKIPSYTGYIMIEGSSKKFLMYPYDDPLNQGVWKPHEIEIEIAKRYVLGILGVSSGNSRCTVCNHGK